MHHAPGTTVIVCHVYVLRRICAGSSAQVCAVKQVAVYVVLRSQPGPVGMFYHVEKRFVLFAQTTLIIRHEHPQVRHGVLDADIVTVLAMPA